jgi:hypothetical protein
MNFSDVGSVDYIEFCQQANYVGQRKDRYDETDEEHQYIYHREIPRRTFEVIIVNKRCIKITNKYSGKKIQNKNQASVIHSFIHPAAGLNGNNL